MDRKIKIFFNLIYTVEILVSLIILYVLWNQFHSLTILICIFIITLLHQIGNYLYFKVNQRNMHYFARHITNEVDEMLNGNYIIKYEEQYDTIENFIDYKLQQLYNVIYYQKKNTVEEKDNLQQAISHISHQLHTPMASISIVGEMFSKGINSETEYQMLTNILNRQIKKIDFLIHSFIKISLLETNIIQLKPEIGYIYDTISAAISSIILFSAKKNIELYVNCPQTIVGFYDVKWTTEVIFNLLDNAVKYTDINGEIHLTVQSCIDYIKIEIKDTGKGISEANQPLIFKRFYREPEVHSIEGTGLGLYLSKKIMDMQNGSITVESVPHKGSTFILYLPKCSGDN
ncbi:MAG: HAMP domain-containing histidine kinase [Clostridium sp.]|nr:HAMP domain-containing histidine kinase [Clostridium sp.]